MTARDWDARTYDRIGTPMTRWGEAVLERLVLRGDERVLDAGCGSGQVTERLMKRLPHGHVVALDGSPQMVDEARQRLAASADRVEFVVADLTRPLPAERMQEREVSRFVSNSRHEGPQCHEPPEQAEPELAFG